MLDLLVLPLLTNLWQIRCFFFLWSLFKVHVPIQIFPRKSLEVSNHGRLRLFFFQGFRDSLHSFKADAWLAGKVATHPRSFNEKSSDFGSWRSCKTYEDSVDGGNPAPVDMEKLPLFTGFYASQVVVWDFWTINRSWWWNNPFETFVEVP